LVYQLSTLEQVGYVTLPGFNDVHHVYPNPDGHLLIANTGLDMVLEISERGEVIREWAALDEDAWSRFSRETDYRGMYTQPHASHPNFIFMYGDEIWVTRFRQMDAICLTNNERRIHIGGARVHDGIVRGHLVYFTRVDGWIVVADLRDASIVASYDLNECNESEGTLLGWCRGIEILDDDVMVVGFSRLRSTKLEDNVRWARRKLRGRKHTRTLPTRLTAFDPNRNAVIWEYDLEPAGCNAVFSVHHM
jgi:hypothetical protein